MQRSNELKLEGRKMKMVKVRRKIRRIVEMTVMKMMSKMQPRKSSSRSRMH